MAHKSVQSPIRRLDRDTRVKDLIGEDTRWWNVPLVKEIFMEDEAERICSMSINSNRKIDQSIWINTSMGDFR
jgi:hypothetical protein